MRTTTYRQHARPEDDDIPTVLLEAIVYAITGTVRLLCWVLVQVVRAPVLALAAAALAGVGVRFGTTWLAVTISLLVVGVLGWRLAWPASFARHARPRLATVARSIQYRACWPRLARRAGLVVHDWSGDHAARPDPVRLTKVQVTASGLQRLHLRLPAGMAPGEVTDRTEALAHALRARTARVVPDRPGRVVLQLWRTDTLQQVVPPQPIPAVLDLASVPVGRCEDGQPWSLRLAGTHVLVAGATGAGKSSVLWSLLRALSRGIRDKSVQVWAVDPKGGMELRPGRGLFARFEDHTPEDMCALLEELVALKDERAKTLAATGQRLHTRTASSPHIVVILDELATLTAFAERAVTRRIDTALGLLLTQGRACGITVVAAVQDPGKDIVGWRDLFPTRIAMRLDNPIQVGMVLGEGAREAGARADEISEGTPGVAYVRVEGTRQSARVRAGYLTDQDITDLSRGTAPTTGGAPGETSDQGGAAVLHVIKGSDLP